MPTEKPKETEKKHGNTTGESLSTAGFAVAIASIFTNFFTLGIIAVVALVLSIMGRIQTSRAGRPNTLALVGIIISGVVIFFTLIAFSLFIMLAVLSGANHRKHCDTLMYTDQACQELKDEEDAPSRPGYRYERQLDQSF